MRSTPEPFEAPLNLPPKQVEQKPDTYTQVRPGIVKNDRTGQLQTNLPDPRPVQGW